VRLSAFGRFALLAAEKRRTLIISPWSYGVQHHCQPLGSVLHHLPVTGLTITDPGSGPGP
jgi:hypothetical protein